MPISLMQPISSKQEKQLEQGYSTDSVSKKFWKISENSHQYVFGGFHFKLGLQVSSGIPSRIHLLNSYHSLREKCPYLSVFSLNAGKYGPEKLRIRTLFTQWLVLLFSNILKAPSCILEQLWLATSETRTIQTIEIRTMYRSKSSGHTILTECRQDVLLTFYECLIGSYLKECIT